MTQTLVTADIIAKEALIIPDNDLEVLNTFYRAHESEFDKKVNGYSVGESISIRRPHDPTVRSGEVMDVKEIQEGKVTLTVDQVRGHDFRLSQVERQMKIEDLGERVIRPAMINILNEIVRDCLDVQYKRIYNWVGTPGQRIDAFTDFSKAPERLDEMLVPQTMRVGVLSPNDNWGVIGAQTALYNGGLVSNAYTDGSLGRLAGVKTYSTALVPTHTNGTWAGSPLVRGASQNVTYDTAKNTWTQTLITDGWTGSVTITEGSVFTIADCYMVNPRTKARTNILQNFVVCANVTADASSSNATSLTISPPIITSGPHQTVEFTSDMDDNVITPFGSASTGYRQNMVFHKNTTALAIVPMEMPEGTVGGSRQSKNGISVRVLPVYDGVNNISAWRMDVMYARKVVDPRLATRVSGT